MAGVYHVNLCCCPCSFPQGKSTTKLTLQSANDVMNGLSAKHGGATAVCGQGFVGSLSAQSYLDILDALKECKPALMSGGTLIDVGHGDGRALVMMFAAGSLAGLRFSTLCGFEPIHNNVQKVRKDPTPGTVSGFHK